jgi:hypothetical protein
MRAFSRLLLATFCLAFSASTAFACLNDRDINQAEREFKSSYQEDQPATPSLESQPSDLKEKLLVYGGGGAGAVLLIGAAVIGLTTVRKS